MKSDCNVWKEEFDQKLPQKMVVNNCEIKFQIDTGAVINTIQLKFVRRAQRLKKYTKLKMYNKSTSTSLGEANLEVTNPLTHEKTTVNFVIVPNEFDCLLGLETVQNLNLVTINSENFIGKVETDLGDLGVVSLHVDLDKTPRALPSRKIPFAIKDKVKQELENLVSRGILKEVTEPTKWVSQMAVVKKTNGKLRICIDTQPLNEAFMREHYRLPVFDDILPELKNAKMFTKLDVKEAYWHVKLDEESSF
jgi:hypothetical protein